MERTRNKGSRLTPLLVLALLAVSTACDNSEPIGLDTDAVESAQSAVVATAVATTLTSFNAFAGQLPESIAVDGFGNIYVSMAPLGEIWKLDSSGSFLEVVATFPVAGFFGVGGLQFDALGNFYAVNGSSDPDVHGVWEIGSGGAKARVAGTSAISIPNDLAISPDGIIYITDSAGSVWRVLPGGAAEIWVQDETLEGTGAFGLGFPIGANGIVVVAGSKLPVARELSQVSAAGLVVSNPEKGSVVYVPILSDGSAGQPAIVIADPAMLFGIDGITIDAQGDIYGAVNVGNSVVRISSDGTDISVIASGDPLDFPTALTFGAGTARHTLFVVNFALIHFVSNPPTPGDARPGVIAIPIHPAT